MSAFFSFNLFADTFDMVKRYEIEIIQPENGSSNSGRPASQTSHLVRAAQSLGATIIEERNKQS